MICEARTDSAASVIKGSASGCERPRVLVSEDQDDVLAALGLLLKTNGYETEFVKSPAETLKALRSKNFDAVLLDLNYSRDTTSGAEGLELLSKVQALDSTLAVLVMTAWGTIDIAVDAMHRGACEFVQKPWDNAQLLRLLQKQMKRSRDLREKRLREQLEQQEAAQIQRALLPGLIASPHGMTIAASTQPARTVGGDYYDVINLPEQRTAICIADVMGKGLGAALLMSNLQAAVRMGAPEADGPGDLCSSVNHVVSANSMPGKFISFFYCVADLRAKRLSYTNAGHNWPILARSNGDCQRLKSDDVVLGTVPQWDYHELETGLGSGDRLVLFTDGITECANAEGAEFGEERLLHLVSQNVHLPAEELKNLILRAVKNHCADALSDDATLIVVAVE